MLTVYLDQNETEVRGRGLQVACARVLICVYIGFLLYMFQVSTNNDKNIEGPVVFFFFFFFFFSRSDLHFF